MKIQKIDITKIADELEKRHELQFYWDYTDSLSEEQAIKIIKEEEEGLNDIENVIWENNFEYISENVNSAIGRYKEENNIELTDDEQEELKQECESRFSYDINGLIKNSRINIRAELLSNEDMICFVDNQYKGSDTIKEFKRVFKGKYKNKDLKKECLEMVNDYGLITFYFEVRGLDILKLREQVLKGFIELRAGLEFGFFNSWIGGGSVLEIPLLKPIKLNLKDWRIKNVKEGVLKRLEEGDKSYYSVKISADNLSKYSIQQVYNLAGWQEF